VSAPRKVSRKGPGFPATTAECQFMAVLREVRRTRRLVLVVLVAHAASPAALELLQDGLRGAQAAYAVHSWFF